MNYSVSEGGRFGPLICNASCGPPCTFRWFGPASSINFSELVINNATRKDYGTYLCGATNKMGTSKGHIVLIINCKFILLLDNIIIFSNCVDMNEIDFGVAEFQ